MTHPPHKLSFLALFLQMRTVASGPRPPWSVDYPAGADVVGGCAGAREVEIYDMLDVREKQRPPGSF